ncbi:MAG: hypothetical protein HFJ52_05610, partial [Clostridia bacterium]|nr:hypothetical protein [Clostridia bacterium]
LVTDGAGNIGKSAEDNSNGTSAVIPSANTAPVVQSVTYKEKTTNSITVTARATDAQNDNLTYTLYTSTNNSIWTQKATSSPVSSGSTVTLTASGLSQYTYYYLKVRATETSSRTFIWRERIWNNTNILPAVVSTIRPTSRTKRVDRNYTKLILSGLVLSQIKAARTGCVTKARRMDTVTLAENVGNRSYITCVEKMWELSSLAQVHIDAIFAES